MRKPDEAIPFIQRVFRLAADEVGGTIPVERVNLAGRPWQSVLQAYHAGRQPQ